LLDHKNVRTKVVRSKNVRMKVVRTKVVRTKNVRTKVVRTKVVRKIVIRWNVVSNILLPEKQHKRKGVNLVTNFFSATGEYKQQNMKWKYINWFRQGNMKWICFIKKV